MENKNVPNHQPDIYMHLSTKHGISRVPHPFFSLNTTGNSPHLPGTIFARALEIRLMHTLVGPLAVAPQRHRGDLQGSAASN